MVYRKKKKFRLSEEKIRNREAFVEWIRRIKSAEREKAINTDFFIEANGWGRDNAAHFLMERSFASPEMTEIRGDRYSKDFEDGLQSLGNHTLGGVLQRGEVAVSVEKIEGARLEDMVELISERANDISQNNVKSIRQYYDEDFGFAIEVTVNQSDKEAFETWFRLIEAIKPLELGILIAVDWTGDNFLSEDELVHKTVDVMLKLGIGPQRTDRFSAVEGIKEGWL